MMRRGNERKSSSSSSSSSSAPLNCDVGLGLRMQVQDTDPSYTCDGVDSAAAAVSFTGYSSSNIHGGVPLPRTYSRASRSMGGKSSSSSSSLFTASQLEELERQKMIHKYLMAAMPVPPELLLLPNSSSSTSHSPLNPHSNSLELRYSSGGSDAEPWRCKRTDGKKWRCSRDVAPDHKYCERHAHKNKPRSRKHVEPSPNQDHQQQQSGSLQPPLRSQFPRIESAASYDQSRCIEGFLRGAATNTCTELKGTDHDKYCNSILGSNMETKRLIDGWDNRDLDGITKFSPNSLTLSIPGMYDGHHRHQDNLESSSYIGMVMMNPGGPLGEVLSLGNPRGGVGTGMNVASPHHNSSKSSYEDDSHALNFIG